MNEIVGTLGKILTQIPIKKNPQKIIIIGIVKNMNHWVILHYKFFEKNTKKCVLSEANIFDK